MGKSKLILVHGAQGSGKTREICKRIRTGKFVKVYEDFGLIRPRKELVNKKDAAIIYEVRSVKDLIRKVTFYKKCNIPVFFEFQTDSGELTPSVLNHFDEVIDVKRNDIRKNTL